MINKTEKKPQLDITILDILCPADTNMLSSQQNQGFSRKIVNQISLLNHKKKSKQTFLYSTINDFLIEHGKTLTILYEKTKKPQFTAFHESIIYLDTGEILEQLEPPALIYEHMHSSFREENYLIMNYLDKIDSYDSYSILEDLEWDMNPENPDNLYRSAFDKGKEITLYIKQQQREQERLATRKKFLENGGLDPNPFSTTTQEFLEKIRTDKNYNSQFLPSPKSPIYTPIPEKDFLENTGTCYYAHSESFKICTEKYSRNKKN